MEASLVDEHVEGEGGEVVGEGVDGLQIGQRVAAASVHGTWAEAFIAPARMVIPMPESIPDEMAAQLIAMPLSALMLLEFLKVDAGQWIVQNTANGAVGKSLAMLAREDVPEEVAGALFTKYKIHTVAINWENIHGVRVTPNVYTSLQDLDKLVRALRQIRG
mgnify:CR=1 FL=1